MTDDLISRQAAIDLFPNDALEWDTKGGYVAPHIVRRMIEELPSADAVPIRHGKWIHPYLGWGHPFCSECEFELMIDDTPYCPKCGARMEGGRDEPTKRL